MPWRLSLKTHFIILLSNFPYGIRGLVLLMYKTNCLLRDCFRHHQHSNKIVWLFRHPGLVAQLVLWSLSTVIQIVLLWILPALKTSVWDFPQVKFSQTYRFNYPTSLVKTALPNIKTAGYRQCFCQVNPPGNQIWRVHVHKQGIKLKWDTMRKRKLERMYLHFSLSLYILW